MIFWIDSAKEGKRLKHLWIEIISEIIEQLQVTYNMSVISRSLSFALRCMSL